MLVVETALSLWSYCIQLFTGVMRPRKSWLAPVTYGLDLCYDSILMYTRSNVIDAQLAA